jgi:putative peptide zinc metalloprotease protein
VPDPLLSPSWYRVASLRPRLRKQARFHRHVYRGQVWYVVQDRASGRCQRLTPSAYQIVGLMDGRRTTQELWEAAGTRLGDEGPTQDETIRLLGLLHAADVLRCDVSPDVEELFRRTRRREQQQWWQRVTSPLSLRLPLADPDAFLARWVPLVAPLFSRGGAVACALPIAVALVFAGVNADEIASAGPSRLLETRNLLLLWLVYPLVKALHELGHAAATKVWGGEVHEMGIMFLVLVPVPYVEASAASAFPEKGRRILVGAVGILVELVLASLALLVWLAVEPGLARDVAYAVMWIGGASTLFFNGNPLLRFDGYYVLADAVEIPNLKTRSTQYLSYLVLNRLFGVESARHPVSAPGEAAWFAVYGVTSFLYRLVVVFGIALFISRKFFVLGTLLAISVVATSFVVPLLRQIAFLLTSPRLGARRPRAIATSAGLAAAAAALVFLVPTPVFTTTQGVLWPPERSQVRAGADAFVLRLLVEPGTRVEAGQPLVLTRDATLEADAAVLEGKLRELRTRYHAERRTHRGRAQILADKIAGVETALARARERVGEVVVRSPAAGRFVVPRASDLADRFVEQGQPLAWVMGRTAPTARVVVPQADVDLVRNRTRGVQVRLASQVGEVLAASVRREVPAASDRLPTRALGAAGGGPFAVDPTDASGVQTREKVFQFDLGLPEGMAANEIGTRVYVRFDHGWEPLAGRLARAVRRLFLRHIGA